MIYNLEYCRLFGLNIGNNFWRYRPKMYIIRFAGFAFLWILLRDNYLAKFFFFNLLPNWLRRAIFDLKKYLFFIHTSNDFYDKREISTVKHRKSTVSIRCTYSIKNQMSRSKIRNWFNIFIWNRTCIEIKEAKNFGSSRKNACVPSTVLMFVLKRFL